MSATVSTSTPQNIEEREGFDEEAYRGTHELIEFIKSEWRAFCASPLPMKSRIGVPESITSILVMNRRGALAAYTITQPATLWFMPKERRGYNEHRICVANLLDHSGRPHQLSIDRTRGDTFDQLVMKIRPLGQSRGGPDRGHYLSRHMME